MAMTISQFKEKFKAGDLIVVNPPCYANPCFQLGEQVEIISISNTYVKYRTASGRENSCLCQWYDSAQLVKRPKGIITMVSEFIKDQALKVSNPDEYVLRQAGLHDASGDLTQEGKDAVMHFAAKFFEPNLVQLAKDINDAAQDKK